VGRPAPRLVQRQVERHGRSCRLRRGNRHGGLRNRSMRDGRVHDADGVADGRVIKADRMGDRGDCGHPGHIGRGVVVMMMMVVMVMQRLCVGHLMRWM